MVNFKENFVGIKLNQNNKNNMKVIIAGCRDFTDYQKLKQFCDYTLTGIKDIEIVSGTQRGADKLGERYAEENNYPIERFYPDWNLYGNSAGPRRNTQMADYADILIAFWDGKSRGTQDMINKAYKKKLIVIIEKI